MDFNDFSEKELNVIEQVLEEYRKKHEDECSEYPSVCKEIVRKINCYFIAKMM